MPKKRLNIILILVVLGLWGTVAFKSLNNFFPSENNVFGGITSSQNFNLTKIEKDTFSLENLKRDPFLDKALSRETNVVSLKSSVSHPKVVAKPKPVENLKPMQVWPQVSYYGYIKSQQKTEELILVKIENNLLKVRKNQNIEGLIIKRIFKDSIEIVFNKQKKFVYLNN
jgi:hypothetical protein